MNMNKEEFRQRAALAALPEIIRLVKDNPKVIDPKTGGRRVEDMQSIAAEIAIGYADALVKKMSEVVPDQKPISDETREEMINRYRAMMKANEGKSFKERRDAINNFRSGKL